MQEHRYQSPFRSLKRRHWHGANVLHWEMDILTLVITHLTKWPQKGYTDACDYTSYKVAAKIVNLESSHKREKSFDPFYLAESAESMSFSAESVYIVKIGRRATILN